MTVGEFTALLQTMPQDAKLVWRCGPVDFKPVLGAKAKKAYPSTCTTEIYTSVEFPSDWKSETVVQLLLLGKDSGKIVVNP